MKLLPCVMVSARRQPAGIAAGVRGPRVRRSLALGAVALAAASVALAGCAVVPAPGDGATATSSGSASAGPGGVVVRSGTRPAPGPRQRAVADADAILAAFAVPPGAKKLPGAPGVAGGVLRHASQLPGSPDLVDQANWWLAPGTPQGALAWETAHVPHRFAADGTGSSGSAAGTVLDDDFSLPAVYGVLDSRDLVVQAVADGTKTTAIRVDAQVVWTPARPASERVPSAVRAVTISAHLGSFPGTRAKPPRPVTITDPAQVRQLVALIDGLPLTPPFEYACPAGWDESLTLTFRAGPARPALAVATAQLSGCPSVDFTIGGRTQPELAAVSAAQILKIAGLNWNIPVR